MKIKTMVSGLPLFWEYKFSKYMEMLLIKKGISPDVVFFGKELYNFIQMYEKYIILFCVRVFRELARSCHRPPSSWRPTGQVARDVPNYPVVGMCKRAGTHTYTHTHTQKHCTHTRTHARKQARTRACAHTHTHTHTHTREDGNTSFTLITRTRS